MKNIVSWCVMVVLVVVWMALGCGNASGQISSSFSANKVLKQLDFVPCGSLVPEGYVGLSFDIPTEYAPATDASNLYMYRLYFQSSATCYELIDGSMCGLTGGVPVWIGDGNMQSYIDAITIAEGYGANAMIPVINADNTVTIWFSPLVAATLAVNYNIFWGGDVNSYTAKVTPTIAAVADPPYLYDAVVSSDCTLKEVRDECAKCGTEGYDVGGVLGVCSKINFDVSTSAFTSICGSWTAADLAALLNGGNPTGSSWTSSGDVLSCSGDCPSSIWFVSLDPAVEILPGGGCDSIAHLRVKDCNSDAMLDMLTEIADNSCGVTAVSEVLCVNVGSGGIYSTVSGGSVTLNGGDEVVVSQLIDCKGNPQTYSVSALVGGALEELSGAIGLGACPSAPDTPVNIGCVKDAKGSEWNVWEVVINGTTVTYYLDSTTGSAGNPSGVPASWTECGTVNVTVCGSSVPVNEKVASWDMLHRHTEEVCDVVGAVIGGSITNTITAPATLSLNYGTVTVSNDVILSFITDFGNGHIDVGTNPSYNYTGQPALTAPSRYEVKVWAITASGNILLLNGLEYNWNGTTLSSGGSSPLVNRTYSVGVATVYQDYCNGAVSGGPYTANGSAYTVAGTLRGECPVVRDERWANADATMAAGGSSSVTAVTPVYSTNRTSLAINTIPAAYNVAAPANLREISVQNVTGSDITVTTSQGPQIVRAGGSITISNPNTLDMNHQIITGNITVSFFSSVLGNISGQAPRVILNFKSYL